jgi:predicted Zn-dependent protease
MVLAISLVLSVSAAPVSAQRGLPLIRDAEIEGLLRLYTRDIFKAAGLNPSAIRVHLINASSINAFVAGGQRIFVHTGLLEQALTPNEVIGVMAHETAHIAGGHLARLGLQIDKLSTASIIGMLIGAAAIAGAAASGQGGAASAGQGVLLGSQSIAQRSLLSYVRAQESAADQAAVKYLTAT